MSQPDGNERNSGRRTRNQCPSISRKGTPGSTEGKRMTAKDIKDQDVDQAFEGFDADELETLDV
ncbi:hypothetical protein ABZ192_20955, partial [Streptomyces sp. NPDC006235]